MGARDTWQRCQDAVLRRLSGFRTVPAGLIDPLARPFGVVQCGVSRGGAMSETLVVHAPMTFRQRRLVGCYLVIFGVLLVAGLVGERVG